MVTRDCSDPAVMIRFVCGPDGMLIPDLAAKLPGRGAWISPRREVLEKGLEKGQIKKAVGATDVLPDLAKMIGPLLLRRVQETLSLGRRTGRVIGGGGKIRAMGDVAGLIIATDASPREARALIGDVGHDWVEQSLASDQIGAAFGRGGLAFAAMLAGDARLEKRVRDEMARLSGFLPV